MDNLIKIGRINKAFGLKGHLRAFVEPTILSRIKKFEVFFLSQKGQPLPYFIDEHDFTDTGHGMVHFEEVNDKTTADFLVGKEILLDKKFLKKEKPAESLNSCIGFLIKDENLGMLGTLTDIMQLPQHDLGQFFYDGKEVLMPLNEEVIRKIDAKEKIIHVRLPEGLLDVYLK